ncbi:hypothetical protein LTR66_000824 [Elasticomyces elasticus]|nr:hypothetical protein LTR66_000824 [Elasticomyces elasticus]
MWSINPKGRDWSQVVNFDDVGKIYVALTVAWSAILFAGMAWLIVHRHLSFLKIRNIPLAIAATAVLHVYLVKILLAYTVNGHFPCDAEFWIMNIYLPMGIALFQANMVQLQSISGQQMKLLEGQNLLRADVPQRQPGLRGLWVKWRSMTAARRAGILITAGMAVQFAVTTAIYLASRKFHRSWGFGTIDPKPSICRRGWEWIPSTVWQLFFSWFYGPYVLYKIRNISDIHYWRLQITICVIAGLPGSPLWLAALYSDKLRRIDRYWVPPMWLAPGLVMMQFVTVFFPIFEAYKSRYQLRSTLDIVPSWEAKRQGSDSTGSSSSKHHTLYRSTGSDSTSSITLRRRKGMYTMAHLEKALMINATPLLHFAASKEFTGENIIFLIQVRDWRAAWNRALRSSGTVTGQVRQSLFKLAVQIYVSSISTKTADFPVNIESKFRSDLEALFASAVSGLGKDCNNMVVDPFNHPSSLYTGTVSSKAFDAKTDQHVTVSELSTFDHSTSEIGEAVVSFTTEQDLDASPLVSEPVAIPAAFDEHIFDKAEQSVKYMVLTNTWPKFVDSRRESEC